MEIWLTAIALVFLILVFWELSSRTELKPVSNVEWRIEVMAKYALVRVFWNPSPSTDIKRQFVRVNGEVEELDISATEYTFEAEEGAMFDVTVVVSDGTFEASATVNIVVPDLTAPQPVQGLGWEIISVKEEVEE